MFPFSYGEDSAFLKEVAVFFGLPDSQVTTHCLRRGAGGGTCHFTTFANYDLAAEHGKWRHIKDFRMYIDAAVADLAEFELSD